MARKSYGGRRMHVILTKPQDDALAKLSRKTALPVAEHIRRALDIYLTKFAEPMSRK